MAENSKNEDLEFKPADLVAKVVLGMGAGFIAGRFVDIAYNSLVVARRSRKKDTDNK